MRNRREKWKRMEITREKEQEKKKGRKEVERIGKNGDYERKRTRDEEKEEKGSQGADRKKKRG